MSFFLTGGFWWVILAPEHVICCKEDFLLRASHKQTQKLLHGPVSICEPKLRHSLIDDSDMPYRGQRTAF